MSLSIKRKIIPQSINSSPKQSPRIGIKISPKNRRIRTASFTLRKRNSIIDERRDILQELESDLNLGGTILTLDPIPKLYVE